MRRLLVQVLMEIASTPVLIGGLSRGERIQNGIQAGEIRPAPVLAHGRWAPARF